MSIGEEIIAKYLKSQHNLLRFENVGQDSCLLSLPLNFTAHTRVELAVTRLSSDQYILTDQGQTLGELHDAGYAINAKLLERLKQIIKVWQVELAGVTLTRTTKEKDLGNALHDFGQAAKTVGDAYLVMRDRETDDRIEEEIKDQVRRTFMEHQYFYRESQNVPGQIEKGYKVDFYIPANGSNGLALEVLTKPNRLTAEAWGFRARDMKQANERLVVGFVYDETTKDLNRTILNSMGDIALPASEFIFFAQQLEEHRVSRGHA
jgi:hypothetical protein